MKYLRQLTSIILIIGLGFFGISALASSPPESEGKVIPSISTMLQKVMPAVVNITVLGQLPAVPVTLQMPGTTAQKRAVTPKFQSVGSGVIVDAKKGYIVTNAHVVKDAKLITVMLSNGTRLRAKLIGKDVPSDIAVLQVKPEHLTALPFADSDKLKVGDFVAAIGNPFGLHQTVTSGVVSALHRSGLGIEGPGGYENFIQTDAPINPGNSGGALVNLNGDLVGINTAIYTPVRMDGNVGIGFSIPSNMVKRVMTQLIEHGKVERGLIGVMVQNLSPELADAFDISGTKGALITHVLPNSPAAKAGLKPEDVIETVNSTPVTNAAQLRNITGLLPVGSQVSLKVKRDKKTIHVNVRIANPKILAKARSSDIPPLLAGVKLEDIDQLSPALGHVRGLGVLYVDQTSMAWLDGLRPGDVILTANGQTVTNVSELTKVAGENKKRLLLKVQRLGGVIFLVIS